jgi:hypothetical protein
LKNLEIRIQNQRLDSALAHILTYFRYTNIKAENFQQIVTLTSGPQGCFIRPLAKVLIDQFIDRQDACPTRKNNFCGTGILPVLFIFARGLLFPQKILTSIPTPFLQRRGETMNSCY